VIPEWHTILLDDHPMYKASNLQSQLGLESVLGDLVITPQQLSYTAVVANTEQAASCSAHLALPASDCERECAN
jgi:hypothetical protein